MVSSTQSSGKLPALRRAAPAPARARGESIYSFRGNEDEAEAEAEVPTNDDDDDMTVGRRSGSAGDMPPPARKKLGPKLGSHHKGTMLRMPQPDAQAYYRASVQPTVSSTSVSYKSRPHANLSHLGI